MSESPNSQTPRTKRWFRATGYPVYEMFLLFVLGLAFATSLVIGIAQYVRG